jgi:transcriptional regulator with XRE-family HTH domain
MKKLTDDELTKAFRIWLMKYSAKEAEEALAPYLAEKIKPFAIGDPSWLKAARKGLFLSAATVAEKLKVARAAYSKYEECEERGSITLATLAKAAEAMDCELVYAIRPRNKKYFSNIIWGILLPSVSLHPWIKKCDQKKRAAALAHIAVKFMNDPEFRKKQRWSQRAN